LVSTTGPIGNNYLQFILQHASTEIGRTFWTSTLTFA